MSQLNGSEQLLDLIGYKSLADIVELFINVLAFNSHNSLVQVICFGLDIVSYVCVVLFRITVQRIHLIIQTVQRGLGVPTYASPFGFVNADAQ